MRADVFLFKVGIAKSRSHAQALISGGVLIGGKKIEKPSTDIPEDTEKESVVVLSPSGYVGRGGIKLRHALKMFGIDAVGLTAVDLGASTGGFTDCLLQSGAKKVYAVDVAMMDQRENAFAGENLGHRLETIVAIHLVRKCKSEGLDVYYLNDRSGECDFVVCKGNQVIQAIQVSYDISAENTYKREKNGLLLAARQTKCENLLLLTDHESGEIEEDGHKMKIQPVYEWSLELGV